MNFFQINELPLSYKALNLIDYMWLIIVTIGVFVHGVCGDYQREMKLISRLNDFFNFDPLINHKLKRLMISTNPRFELLF